MVGPVRVSQRLRQDDFPQRDSLREDDAKTDRERSLGLV